MVCKRILAKKNLGKGLLSEKLNCFVRQSVGHTDTTTMQTRQQSKVCEEQALQVTWSPRLLAASVVPQGQPYTVEIDFDEASIYWKANKISTGLGTYTYRDKEALSPGRVLRSHTKLIQ
jgi:hypothetical protein